MSTELQVGKIEGEPIDQYHETPAVSVSKIKIFRESPFLYFGRFVAKTIEAPEPTAALNFGNAAHKLILEGDEKFLAKYYATPEGCGRQSKEDKLTRANLAMANPGKEAISFDENVALQKMAENVKSHRFAGQLIAACKPEITWRVKGELFHMQARTDGWAEEGCEITQGTPFIADLKTISRTPDDEPETISRQIADYWYHGQEYVYREIVSEVMKYPPEFRPRFFFVFVESKAPHGVQVVELDAAALDLAYKQTKETMERLTHCHKTQSWPLTWNDTWQMKVPAASLPSYYVRRETLEDRNLW